VHRWAQRHPIEHPPDGSVARDRRRDATGGVQHYQIEQRLRSASVTGGSEAPTLQQRLVGWCTKQTSAFDGVHVTDPSASFADGLAFCALVASVSGTLDFACTAKVRGANYVALLRVIRDPFVVVQLAPAERLERAFKCASQVVATHTRTHTRTHAHTDAHMLTHAHTRAHAHLHARTHTQVCRRCAADLGVPRLVDPAELMAQKV
jgi:hypothetical protein